MKTIIYLILIVTAMAACSRANTNDKQTADLTDSLFTGESANIQTSNEKENCDYKFVVESIQKNDFDKLYAQYYKEYIPKKITDFDSVKKLLNNVVVWLEEQGVDENGNSVTLGHPLKINFRNGKTLELINDESLQTIKDLGWGNGDYSTLQSYFPDEDILLLHDDGDCGDCGDSSFNLTTGDQTEVAGNPEITYYPPTDKRHRIRGYYNGYVTVYYFQEKQGENYINICSLENYTFGGNVFSDMRRVFFTNDITFYFEHEGDYNVTYYRKATIENLKK